MPLTESFLFLLDRLVNSNTGYYNKCDGDYQFYGFVHFPPTPPFYCHLTLFYHICAVITIFPDQMPDAKFWDELCLLTT